MSNGSRGSEVYSWGDTLSLVGADLSGSEVRPQVALAVGADRTEEARSALARAGWAVRSLRELGGRAGILIQAEKA
jgi:hypothetical protein